MGLGRRERRGHQRRWGGLPHRVDAVQRAKGDGLGKEGDVVRHILLETLEGALDSLLTRHGPSATSGAGAAAAASWCRPAFARRVRRSLL